MPDECTPLMCEVNGNDFFLVSLSFFLGGGGFYRGEECRHFVGRGLGDFFFFISFN